MSPVQLATVIQANDYILSREWHFIGLFVFFVCLFVFDVGLCIHTNSHCVFMTEKFIS